MKFQRFGIGVLLVLAFWGTEVEAGEKAKQRPNILWIVAEDLNPAFGCYGDPVNKGHTPILDKMAQEGVLFSRCYVTAPVCSPCRSAIITGAYQTTLGIHNHRSSRSKLAPIQFPEGVKTIPELFRMLGYFTFNIGKDDYNFVYDRSELYAAPNRNYPWRGREKGQPFFGQIQLRGGKWFFALLSGRKKLAVRAAPEKTPVPPYFPDNPLMHKHFAVHKDTARVTDMEIGQILARLAEDGLLENTIVIFFSDHGMPNSVRHKQFCYEGGVHVPLVMIGPGIPKGQRRNEMISSLDISATTVRFAGMKKPKWFEGQDLFGKDYRARKYVISARDRCDYTIDRIRTVRTEKYRYIRNFMTDRPWLQPQYRDGRDFLEGVRTMYKAGKLNEVQARFFGPTRPKEELYDLTKDPHQIRNLADNKDYADVLLQHRKILSAWMKKTDDKGQYPESDNGLLEVMLQWREKCVNPEYKRVRKRYEELKNTPGQKKNRKGRNKRKNKKGVLGLRTSMDCQPCLTQR
ncbi:MAG: sulfatase [Gemmataceae bacterium]